MSSSAIFMGILGIAASFLPQEILIYFDSHANKPVVLIVQITGALYMGFAILNWMAKGNLIGGIYSRPVALGNFLHFTIVALALLKALIAGQNAIEIVMGTAVYLIFAMWFGFILFGSPVKKAADL